MRGDQSGHGSYLFEVEVSHIQPSMCTAHEQTAAAMASTNSGSSERSATWRGLGVGVRD